MKQLLTMDPIKRTLILEQVFNWLCIGLAGSLVFWPLLNSIFAILVFLFWIFFMKKRWDWKNRDVQLVCLFIALYLLVLIGTSYSSNMKEAIFKIQQKSALLIFPIVFGCTASVQKSWSQKKILLWFSGFTILGCGVCWGNGLLYFFKTGNTDLLHGYGMVVLKDTSPFILALFCFLTVAILLYYLSTGEIKSRLRSLAIASVLLASFFLLLLGNRNILFCWIIVLIVFFYQLVKRKSTLVFFLVGLSAVLGLTVVFNPSLRQQWNDAIDFSTQNNIQLDTDQSLGRAWGGKTIRISIRTCSWDVIKEKWITGVGTGDVQDALQAAYENRKFYFASRYNRYNAHNQYIQETLATGFAGLLIFIMGIAVPLYRFIGKKPCQLYCLFLLCFLIICLTESILELNKGIVFYSFFNSLFAFTKKINT